ncbi:phosphoglycerate mutase [Sugiyamaella lignohabitans]|uniref:Phosphoglycerate mutase n=1 Tax=Sugiyamaella lignohabitans TaxID=796027 RepID=A0A167FH97_9ASCO|nr:phosphoglycerate mutase [Sugiyamaella lignohabitans]ANB15295.1 phosphoglycerate mutase [Sugiyamaella lignohabitans]
MTVDDLQIILVRHGQTDCNKQHILQGHLDSPLNEIGQLQASAAGKRLDEDGVVLDAVWSSDLTRCKETTRLILAQNETHSKLEIVFQQELRERAMGEIEGMSITDAREKALREGKTFHDYGEPKQVSVRRLNAAFDKIVDESIAKQHKTVLVVSHGGEYI